MQDRIAAATSVVFSPFLVPIATILVIAQNYATTGHQTLLWIAIFITFFSILPVFFIFILFRLGRVSSLNLSAQEQRTSPLLFAMGTAFVGVGILYVIGAPPEIMWAGIAYVVNGVIFVAITQIWKISFHTGVTAGCITVLVLIVHIKFGWLSLLLPLIAWARVRRKRHTLVQAVVGVLIAVISTAVVLQLSVGIGFRS